MSLELHYPIQKCIEIQQEKADDILEKLFPIDPYAICAGGAPRDWHFGEVATDLDIFVYTPMNQVAFEKALAVVGITVESVQQGGALPEWYKKNPHLNSVFNVVWGSTKVQIMLMREPTFKSVIPQFPLSICKAWYKNYKIHLDRDFKRGENHKVIVKTNTVYNNEHAYIKKIVDKFPEYKYYASWEKAAGAILDKGVV